MRRRARFFLFILFALWSGLPFRALAQTAASTATTVTVQTLDAARKSAATAMTRDDFSSRLTSLADALPPFDAVALLKEFAPKISDGDVSKALLTRAGRLAILVGAYDTAADVLEAAAFRLPTARDDALLLLSARCRLAAGEADKAGDRAAIVLRSTGDLPTATDARLVAAWSALVGGDPLAASASARMIEATALPKDSAVGGAAEREALFIVWAAAPAADRDKAAAALARAFPDSPEASIAASYGQASPARAWVDLSPLPLWYLGGVLAPEKASPEKAKEAASSPAVLPPPADTGAPSAEFHRFQIGIFSDPNNATLLVAELMKKGFTAKTEKRKVRGRDLLAVIVEGDPATTVLKLKDAGYEAYPLFP